MKQLLREYGPISALLLVSVFGYLLYENNREDVLSYSLDAIGTRLVGMVDDESSRDAVAAAFGRFKDRVLGGEVAPEQVETLAANVINLRQQATSLTPEQAELVLQSAFYAAAESTDVAAPLPEAVPAEELRVRPMLPRAPSALAPEDREALSQRLDALLAFEETVASVMETVEVEHATLAEHIYVQADEGLQITLDNKLEEVLPAVAFARLETEFKTLEENSMVVWQADLARTLHRERERAAHMAEHLAAYAEHDHSIAVVQALAELQHLGYRPGQAGPDSIIIEIQALDQSIRVDVEAAVEEALEQAADQIEAALEAAAEAAERQAAGSQR